jgi:dipeptidyl aminopeptidase/acylaminoacyl peptidase
MRFSALALFSVLCVRTVVSYAQQPPVLDRELFFGDPEITGAQISPDGKYIGFLKPHNGARNIWVKRTEDPFTAAKPITSETKRPIPAYFWSRDGHYILFVQDQGGDENFNVYAVDPAEAKDAANVPKARNLSDVKGVRAMIFNVPKNDPDTLYVGLNDRDKAWHDLYKVKISTGERSLMRKNTDRIGDWVFDNAGQLRLAYRSAENGDTELLRTDPDGFKKIYSCDVFEMCFPLHFHPDGKRVYIMTNHGAGNLVRLALLDLASGKEELVESDPKNRVDLSNAQFSDLTDKLLATVYEDEKQRINFRDKSIEADYKLIRSKLGGKQITPVSKTKDERLWLVSASSDTEPGETYLFSRDTKKLTLQYRVREKLPRENLAKMEPIRYESSDGKEIPAYLTLPNGVAPKNLPVVIFPHGGPWGRDVWRYNTFAQFLANRGYAVLQPNFRASTGYGKDFLNAGNGQWGRKMQDDITWGVKYLVAKGIADPKRVGIMGISYGGYATLAGVAFTPDLYSAAVAIAAPVNLMTLLDTIPPYWEAGRIQLYRRMGDPHTAEGKKLLEEESPLNSATKIKTPLMVVQGANDPRVKKAEAEQIVVALRDRGFPVEYLLAPDEGHGYARPVNNMAMIMASEKFLAGRLGGRYQEGGTPEVTARLKEITVDPKTVRLKESNQ